MGYGKGQRVKDGHVVVLLLIPLLHLRCSVRELRQELDDLARDLVPRFRAEHLECVPDLLLGVAVDLDAHLPSEGGDRAYEAVAPPLSVLREAFPEHDDLGLVVAHEPLGPPEEL